MRKKSENFTIFKNQNRIESENQFHQSKKNESFRSRINIIRIRSYKI